MFEVGSYDQKANNFTFGRGGFQGARGNDEGGDYFVENVFEEYVLACKCKATFVVLSSPFSCPVLILGLLSALYGRWDYPGEFFFNQSTGDLYLAYNGTGTPPADLEIVVPHLQSLINVTGTQWDPVKNVTHSGIQFSAAAYTYMNPHGVPSAGTMCFECHFPRPYTCTLKCLVISAVRCR